MSNDSEHFFHNFHVVLLSDEGRSMLSLHLGWVGKLAESLHVLSCISQPELRISALQKLAYQFEQRSDTNVSRNLLNTADLEIAQILDTDSRQGYIDDVAKHLKRDFSLGSIYFEDNTIDMTLSTARLFALSNIVIARGRKFQNTREADNSVDNSMISLGISNEAFQVFRDYISSPLRANPLENEKDGVRGNSLDFLGNSVQISRESQYVTHLINLAQAQSRLGNLGEAHKHLQLARRIAEQSSEVQEKANLLVEIARVATKLNEYATALDLLQSALHIAGDINDQGEQFKTIHSIGIEQLRAHDMTAAYDTLAIGIAALMAQSFDEVEFKVSALKRISHGLREKGLFTDAQHILRIAEKMAQSIEDKNVRRESVLSIVVEQVRVKTPLSTIALTDFVDGQETRSEALSKIAQELAKLDNIEDAVIVSAEIEDPNDRVYALREIAQAYARLGDTRATEDMFCRAIESAHDIRFVRDRADASGDDVHLGEARLNEALILAQLAITQDEIIGHKSALGTIEQALRIADDVARSVNISQYKDASLFTSGEKRQEQSLLFSWASTLCFIARAQMYVGEKKAAKVTIGKVMQISRHNWMINDMVMSDVTDILAQMGDVMGAKKSANRLDDRTSRAIAIRKIASYTADSGNAEDAMAILQTSMDTGNRDELSSELALLEAKMRNYDQALKTAAQVEDGKDYIKTVTEIARLMINNGDSREALALIHEVLIGHTDVLPDLAEAFLLQGDNAAFKQLILPCAYNIKSAYRLSGLLVYVDPERAVELSKQIARSH